MWLVNARTGTAIAADVEFALTRAARRCGLLNRDRLEMSSALALSPCWAIHTAFMRFPIDVLFLDGSGRAVKVVHSLPPWRAAYAAGARTVVELAAGALRSREVAVSDQLLLVGGRGGANPRAIIYPLAIASPVVPHHDHRHVVAWRRMAAERAHVGE